MKTLTFEKLKLPPILIKSFCPSPSVLPSLSPKPVGWSLPAPQTLQRSPFLHPSSCRSLPIHAAVCSWSGTEVPAPQPFVHMPSCSFSTQTSAFVKQLMCRSRAKGHTLYMRMCVWLLHCLTNSRCSLHCEISINNSFFHYYIKNPRYFSPITREWSYIIQWVTVKIKLENIFIKLKILFMKLMVIPHWY